MAEENVSIPYIGSKISLINQQDIRYEGILKALNQKESTIEVLNVRSFGTEGRKQPEVPASNEVYDRVVFKGGELKDLIVIQEKNSDPAVLDQGREKEGFPNGYESYGQQAPAPATTAYPDQYSNAGYPDHVSDHMYWNSPAAAGAAETYAGNNYNWQQPDGRRKEEIAPAPVPVRDNSEYPKNSAPIAPQQVPQNLPVQKQEISQNTRYEEYQKMSQPPNNPYHQHPSTTSTNVAQDGYYNVDSNYGRVDAKNLSNVGKPEMKTVPYHNIRDDPTLSVGTSTGYTQNYGEQPNENIASNIILPNGKNSSSRYDDNIYKNSINSSYGGINSVEKNVSTGRVDISSSQTVNSRGANNYYDVNSRDNINMRNSNLNSYENSRSSAVSQNGGPTTGYNPNNLAGTTGIGAAQNNRIIKHDDIVPTTSSEATTRATDSSTKESNSGKDDVTSTSYNQNYGGQQSSTQSGTNYGGQQSYEGNSYNNSSYEGQKQSRDNYYSSRGYDGSSQNSTERNQSSSKDGKNYGRDNKGNSTNNASSYDNSERNTYSGGNNSYGKGDNSYRKGNRNDNKGGKNAYFEKGDRNKKTVKDIMDRHGDIENVFADAVRAQNANALNPTALRKLSEGNSTNYHFFIDYCNFVCPNIAGENEQWECLSSDLKRHFAELCRQNPAPAVVQANANSQNYNPKTHNYTLAGVPPNTGSRPGLTLGDFTIGEPLKKNQKANKKGAVVQKKKPVLSTTSEKAVEKKEKSLEPAATEWTCPRCTLANPLSQVMCGACEFSKNQARRMDEFPPLGAPKK